MRGPEEYLVTTYVTIPTPGVALRLLYMVCGWRRHTALLPAEPAGLGRAETVSASLP